MSYVQSWVRKFKSYLELWNFVSMVNIWEWNFILGFSCVTSPRFVERLSTRILVMQSLDYLIVLYRSFDLLIVHITFLLQSSYGSSLYHLMGESGHIWLSWSLLLIHMKKNFTVSDPILINPYSSQCFRYPSNNRKCPMKILFQQCCKF